ncbi:MAG: hypothetical protein ACXAE3_09805 [Candidatus Kariarchaeaceae archaeon]|jgi:hypothetical protein
MRKIHLLLLILLFVNPVHAQQGVFTLEANSGPQEVWKSGTLLGVEARVIITNSGGSLGSVSVEGLNMTVAPGEEQSYVSSAMRTVVIYLEDPSKPASGTFQVIIEENTSLAFRDLGLLGGLVILIAVIVVAAIRSRD